GSAIVPYTSSASSIAVDPSEVLPSSAHSISTISSSSNDDLSNETDVDCAPVMQKSTTDIMKKEGTDKASAVRLIAECDEMVKKL
ncbi:hypothetical protein PMAYCL1PPCAC_28788, partial [Pristionchus mayeri]